MKVGEGRGLKMVLSRATPGCLHVKGRFWAVHFGSAPPAAHKCHDRYTDVWHGLGHTLQRTCVHRHMSGLPYELTGELAGELTVSHSVHSACLHTPVVYTPAGLHGHSCIQSGLCTHTDCEVGKQLIRGAEGNTVPCIFPQTPNGLSGAIPQSLGISEVAVGGTTNSRTQS